MLEHELPTFHAEPSSSTSSDESSGANTPAIIGGVVAGAFILILAVTTVFTVMLFRHHRAGPSTKNRFASICNTVTNNCLCMCLGKQLKFKVPETLPLSCQGSREKLLLCKLLPFISDIFGHPRFSLQES